MWPPWLCAGVLAVLGLSLPHVSADSVPPTTPGAAGRAVLWNATWTDHLKHDLLMKYDKFARPAQHNNITEVSFNLIIKHIEVDEVRSLMLINAWTNLQWEDEKLRWNASDYGGLTKLNVADHEIWQPDVVLYNSAMGNSVDHYGNTHCLVTQDGKVLWVPPSQFSAYCDLSLRKWPYDQHTCFFFFGSWVYDGEQIKLKRPPRNSSDGEVDLDPCEWSVLSVKEIEHMKYYSCCSEPYYNIEVMITVQRRSPANASVFFTVAFVCMVLSLAVFWLPPTASEKFLVSGVTAIILSMFLLYFVQRLPTMAVNTPLIVEWYVYNLVLVCLSVVVAVVTVRLSRRPGPRPLPRLVTRLLASRFASLLALPTTKSLLESGHDCEELHNCSLVDQDRTESDETTTEPSLSYSRDWILLAFALDRLMFLLYLSIFLFLAAVFYLS